MSAADYERILRLTEHLSPDEQRRLSEEVAARLRRDAAADGERPRLEDLGGTAPYPLCGEDATKYISRMRDEWEEREKLR